MGRGSSQSALNAKELLYGPRRRGQGPQPLKDLDFSQMPPWPQFYHRLLDQLVVANYITRNDRDLVNIDDSEAEQTVAHIIFDINQAGGRSLRLIATKEDDRFGVGLYQSQQSSDTFVPKHVISERENNSVSLYDLEQLLVDSADQTGIDYIDINVDDKHVDNYLNDSDNYQFVGAYWEETHNLDNAKRGANNMVTHYMLDQSTVAAAHLSDEQKQSERAAAEQLKIAIDNISLTDPPDSLFRALASSPISPGMIAWNGGIRLRRNLTKQPLI